MRRMIPLAILLCWLVSLPVPLSAGAADSFDDGEFNPSLVYSQVELIDRESEFIKLHLGIHETPPTPVYFMTLSPRHVWQKGHMILTKIAQFMRQQGMGGVNPPTLEPLLRLSPRHTWAQSQRILTEIRIVKAQLHVSGDAGVAPKVTGKQPLDVFNLLSHVSREWDLITREELNPSVVYAEAMRINDDKRAG